MLLVLHFGVTAILVGLIWTIQWVHYPLLQRVGVEAFAVYHQEHCRRIARLVVPVMAAEVLLVVLCLIAEPQDPWLRLSLIPLALVWGVTALISAPLHRQLSGGAEAAKLRRLVATNWLRTVAWTLRAAVLVPTVL
jgi:hypothetical protein